METEVPKVIWQFWTSDNDLTLNRKNALKSNVNLGIETRLLFPKDIMLMQLEEHPYHPAYQYLSSTQKSDYLRCYFMNYYGGGYADIKSYSKDNNWRDCFLEMDANPDIWEIGQIEHEGGTPVSEYNSPDSVRHLTSNGYFIARCNTPYTNVWMGLVDDMLSQNLESLKRCWNITRSNHQICNEVDKRYPLKWGQFNVIKHRLEYGFQGSGHILGILESGRLRISYR